jgi:hypothetical protein
VRTKSYIYVFIANLNVIHKKEFKDIKGVNRIRISKKNRQHTGQKEKQRSTKHTPKAKDRVTRAPLKPGVNSGAIYQNLIEILFLYILHMSSVLTINNLSVCIVKPVLCVLPRDIAIGTQMTGGYYIQVSSI